MLGGRLPGVPGGRSAEERRAWGRVPIGIGMPLESRLTAERLKENHVGPKIITAA